VWRAHITTHHASRSTQHTAHSTQHTAISAISHQPAASPLPMPPVSQRLCCCVMTGPRHGAVRRCILPAVIRVFTCQAAWICCNLLLWLCYLRPAPYANHITPQRYLSDVQDNQDPYIDTAVTQRHGPGHCRGPGPLYRQSAASSISSAAAAVAQGTSGD
jgi:hypothetical protein